MTTHAKHSASSAKRWMNCPGSLAAIDALPEELRNPTNPSARQGTFAHTLAENALHGKDPRNSLGGRDLTGEFIVDEEMVAAVELYRDTIIGTGVFASEMTVQFFTVDNDDDGFGTADAIVQTDEDALIIWDFKYGFNPVEVPGNEQLLCYLLGAVRTLGRVPTSMRMGVVQPRATHVDGPVRSVVVTTDELRAFKLRLAASWVETEKPSAPRAAGEWCKHCPALAHCAEARSRIQTAVVAQLTDLNAEQPTLRLPAVTDGVDLAKAMHVAAIAERWIKEVHRLGLYAIMQGVEVPGWKAVDGRRTREWGDEETVARIASRKAGGKNVYKKVFVSPAQAEKIPELGKEWVAKYVEWREGRPTLAPANDRRPAITASAGAVAALLSNVEEE